MIIEVVGKEIEKIKGDFESYLNGLNMVGEISYSQYSELYDEGTKQIQRAYELGKFDLEKENAELKTDNVEWEKASDKWKSLYDSTNNQLTKAKEIIKKLLATPRSIYGRDEDGELTSFFNSDYEELKKQAEQFLKDLEK